MAKTILLFFIAFICGVFIQGTLLHSVLPSIVSPDLLVILAVFLGLRARTPWGAVGAFIIGLGADFASAKFLGPCAAGSVVAFASTVFVANHFFSEKWFTVSITALLASLAKNLTQVFILVAFTEMELFKAQFFSTILIESVLTAAFAPLVVKLLAPRYQASSSYSSRSSLRRA